MDENAHPTPPDRLGQLALAFSLLASLALLIVGGAAIMHFVFKQPVYGPLQEAFVGGKELYREYMSGNLSMEFTEPDDSDNSEMNKKMQRYMANAKVTWDKEKSFDGYTLLAVRMRTAVYMLDMDGKVVHRWYMPFRKAFPNPEHVHSWVKVQMKITNFHLYPNGDMLIIYSALGDTPYGYGMAKIDKDSNLIWTYPQTAHHDLYVAPNNGEIYALIQYFQRKPTPGLEKLYFPVLMDYIVKLSPEGKELWRISIGEAFVGTPYQSEYLIRKGWDYFHTNTISRLEPEMAKYFPMFKEGQLLISIRNLNALAVIDPDTKKVVWAARGNWKWQHAACFTKNGTIVMFDNKGLQRVGKKGSRVLELNPKTMETRQIYPTKGERFGTRIYGRLHMLPNGNIMIAEGEGLRALEITSGGELVWSYAFAKKRSSVMKISAVMSATRYPKDYITFKPDKLQDKGDMKAAAK